MESKMIYLDRDPVANGDDFGHAVHFPMPCDMTIPKFIDLIRESFITWNLWMGKWVIREGDRLDYDGEVLMIIDTKAYRVDVVSDYISKNGWPAFMYFMYYTPYREYPFEYKVKETVFLSSSVKVSVLVENTSRKGFPVEHGLSLFIQRKEGKKVLFDMGQGTLFADNAQRLGIDIGKVNVAIISHGHYDHGGGLGTFLEKNSKATVYMHREVFRPHYSLRESGFAYIGLDAQWRSDPRIKYCDSTTRIDEQMILFADVCGLCCCPTGNRLLYEGPFYPDVKADGAIDHNDLANDRFRHEQNLIILDGDKCILFAGCAHNGIVNIMHHAKELTGRVPTHVFGGMHLVKSGLTPEQEDAFIRSLAHELSAFRHTHYYTMHCTGEEQYQKLKSLMGNQIEYLSCGDEIWI